MLICTFHVKLYQLLFLYLETVSQDEKNKALTIIIPNKPIAYFLKWGGLAKLKAHEN